MRAREDLLNRDKPKELRKVCSLYSSVIDQCVDVGTHVLHWIHPEISHQGSGHSIVLLLYRHLLSMLDGAAVLINRSCVEASKPLLRSALECMLGLEYLLEGDTERRGLAYKVADIHRRLTFYAKADPASDQGKTLAKKIQSDPHAHVLSMDVQEATESADRLKGLLQRDPFAEIEAEWRRTKVELRGRTPDWFNLFDGPRNIEMLAEKLHRTVWYEVLYRDWSGTSHAADGLRHVTEGPNGATFWGLRNPDGLDGLSLISAQIFTEVSIPLMHKFAPTRMSDWEAWYQREFRPLYEHLLSLESIEVR